MDEELLHDIKRCLKDALENEDWNCVEEAIEVINDYDGTYSDDSLEE